MSLRQSYSQVRECLIVVEEEQHFRFLDLPTEVRLIIYEFTFDFGSLDRYFKRYFDKKRLRGDNAIPSYMTLGCPSVLLVSKEICNEAKPVLFSTPLSLNYGALDLKIASLISADLLRNLQHITISDIGCRDIETPPISVFTGYCYAVVQLAGQCRLGHRLKTLSVSFKSAYVTKHLQMCLLDPARLCGIKSWVHNLRRYLKELQGLKHVCLDVDLPEDMKNEITIKMLAKPTGLMALPYNVRRKIWSYAVDVNDGIDAMRRVYADITRSLSPPAPVRTTPTILLLNKQINSEASQLMYERPLVISELGAHVAGTVDLERFISLSVLHRMKAIVINITDWRHLAFLKQIKRALEHGHRLQKFHLHFSEPHFRDRTLASGGTYPDPFIVSGLAPLDHLRRIKDVKITGTLPECFTHPLVHNMSKIKTGGKLCILQAEDSEGGRVNVGPETLVQTVLIDDSW